MSIALVTTVLGFYMLCLFGVAFYFEKRTDQSRKLASHPFVYALSLTIYCSMWTIYGSVGTGAQYGYFFLSIYLGPTLSIILWWVVLRKLVRVKNQYHVTSLTEFLVARYSKSEALGAFTTVLVMVGIIPYIALQLKSFFQTFALITQSQNDSMTQSILGPTVVVVMILFTIVSGLRRLDPTERHPGMMMALSIESILKLVAITASGIFIVWGLFDGPSDLYSRIPERVSKMPFYDSFSADNLGTLVAHLIASASAILFLPRQFHVAVVENANEKHILKAMWMFPLYLFLINLFVLPIAFAGLALQKDLNLADTFVLSLPLEHGQNALSLLIFIGGFAAGSAMIVVETMAVSTMMTNSLLLPLVARFDALHTFKKNILQLRWLAATLTISLSYVYSQTLGHYNLVSMGMISFIAFLQFAPAMMGGLFWSRGNVRGAFWGISFGFATWLYTLFIPALLKAGHQGSSLLEHGPFGISFLRPEHLLGLTGLEPVTHAVFWTLLFNCGAYVIGSLSHQASEEDNKTAHDIIQILNQHAPFRKQFQTEKTVDLSIKIPELQNFLHQYLDPSTAHGILEKCLQHVDLKDQKKISILELADLTSELEKALSGILGTGLAHTAIQTANLFNSKEKEQLSILYGKLLTDLRVSPSDLKAKIDYYRHKEELLTKYNHELEAQVNEKTKMLLQNSKLAALGQMAGGVAHEVNNPLGIIRLNCAHIQELLDQKAVDPARLEKSIQMIDRAVTRVADIVRGLLAFSREASQDPLKNESLEKLIKETLYFCQERLKGKGIELVCKLEPQIQIICRFTQISQVLVNLINNATDALENEPQPKWIRLEAFETETHVEIRVTDSGHGIPESVQEKLFQPFYTTKGFGKGTGLGLSVSKGIIESHLGSLEIDSKCANTCFVITLPRINPGEIKKTA